MVVKSLNTLEIEKLLFQPIDDALLLVDEKGRIHFSNTKVEEIFLYKRTSLFNKKIATLFPLKYFSILNTYIYRCFNSDKFDSSIIYKDIKAKRKDDETFDIELQFKRINFQGNDLLLLRIKDESIETISKQQQRIKENKKRLEFVSNTSHELRTPLTSILSAAEILTKFKGSFGYEDVQTKNINRIKDAVHQLTGVLNDFLKLNKIDEYKKIQYSCVKIDEFCNEIINTDFHSKTKALYIKYLHSGRQNIRIDIEMLNSIVNNLLSNAVKYSNKNTIILFETFVHNNKLIIKCKDNGIGIPKEDLPFIFNRYYRSSNIKRIQGTGLGLSIVKEYVDKCGGLVEVDSIQDKGSLFIVTIPLGN